MGLLTTKEYEELTALRKIASKITIIPQKFQAVQSGRINQHRPVLSLVKIKQQFTEYGN